MILDEIATMPRSQYRPKPTWVRNIEVIGNRAVVEFLNGNRDEYDIDDPRFHYARFQKCRRTASLRRYPNNRRQQ